MKKTRSHRPNGVELATSKTPLLEPRLWGTWKSDRKKTFEYSQPTKKLTPQQVRKFRSMFGKLVHIWTRTRVSSFFDCDRFPGSPDRTPDVIQYSVVARDATSVVILTSEIPTRRRKAKASPSGRSEVLDVSTTLLTIHFDGDAGYRICLGSMSEYFSRVE